MIEPEESRLSLTRRGLIGGAAASTIAGAVARPMPPAAAAAQRQPSIEMRMTIGVAGDWPRAKPAESDDPKSAATTSKAAPVRRLACVTRRA